MARRYESICLSVIVILLMLAPAWGWTLEGPQAKWEIDEKTGGIRAATTADGFKAISRSKDIYEVIYADHVNVADESGCTVISADVDGLPTKLSVKCEHAELGLTITKRYRIDERTGWLMKQTSIVAPELDKSFVHLLSHVRVTTPMWRGSYLYHPIWNIGGTQFLKAADVVDKHHFRAADGTGMMTLSNPARNLTIGHVRYAARGEPVFFDHVVQFGSDHGDKVAVVEDRQTDTVATPGQWTMSSMHGAIGNGVSKSVSVEMGYALMAGDLYDFQLAYVALPEIHDILHHAADTTPSWVPDHVIDVWTDYTVDNETTGRAYAKLLDRMWFGWVSMVVFGYYENSYSYPGDDEQWADQFSTVRETEGYIKGLEKRNKSPDDYIVRRGDGELVMRCTWKPSEQRATIRQILAAAGNTTRLKPAIYTHMGTAGQDRESPMARNHPELILRRANDQPYRYASDYNRDRARPVVVQLQGADSIVQDWWVDTLERQLDFAGTDLTYFDSLQRSNIAVDWKQHRAVQSQDMYAMYRRFIEACHERGAALFTNYAVPMFNDMGYTELAGYFTYKQNWRNYAGRMMGQQALNRRGRPLIVVGAARRSDQYPYPPGSLSADIVPFVVHSPLVHNVQISLHPGRRPDPERQANFAHRILPWLQASFELRLRAFVNPHVQPRWWAHETELESQGYNLDKSSGVVAFINHTDEPVSQKVTFETAPLGLKPGKPAWVWRLQMPHPHQVDDVQPADDAPIPRLAQQTLVARHDKLPETLNYEEAWPVETPVMLLITHSPALVESVDGKTSQWLLPEAYGVKVSGSFDEASSRMNLHVTSEHETAALLVLLLGGRDTTAVPMRRVADSGGDAPDPIYEKVQSEQITLNGQRFIRFNVPKGANQFVIH